MFISFKRQTKRNRNRKKKKKPSELYTLTMSIDCESIIVFVYRKRGSDHIATPKSSPNNDTPRARFFLPPITLERWVCLLTNPDKTETSLVTLNEREASKSSRRIHSVAMCFCTINTRRVPFVYFSTAAIETQKSLLITKAFTDTIPPMTADIKNHDAFIALP